MRTPRSPLLLSLPRPPASPQVRAHNEFMLPMQVGRFLAGKAVHAVGLRQLPNAFLVAIERRYAHFC